MAVQADSTNAATLPTADPARGDGCPAPDPPAPVRAQESREIQAAEQPETPARNPLTENEARFCYLRIYGPPECRRSVGQCYARAYGWAEDLGAEFADLPDKKRQEAHRSGQRLMKKDKVRLQIREYQDLERETNQISEATWIREAIEMRDDAIARESFAAAAKLHRDIGEVLGLFVTRVEVNKVPRSNDILSEITKMLVEHPELLQVLPAKQIESVSRPVLTVDNSENQESSSSKLDT